MRNTVPATPDTDIDLALAERFPRPQQLIDAERIVASHRAEAGRVDRVLGRVHHGVIIASGSSVIFVLGILMGLQVAR